MRLNKKYFIWLITGVLFASCTKNLNQTPQSTGNNAVIFGSEDGLKLYSNSFYDSLAAIGDIFRKDGDISDYCAENAIPNLIRPGAYSSRQSTGWTWTKLRNINYFIANNNGPKVPQAIRDNYTGLARFFRACFYYGMVQRFGDVPWISRPLSVDDTAILYSHRDPHAKVMDSVLADLNYAIGHITTSDATRSQVTKWVAYGMKSRVCLFEGTYRKYQKNDAAGANQWLQEAATASKSVMDSAGFSLNTANGTDLSYRNVFISSTPVTSEVMLSIVASQALAVLNDANWWYTSSTYGVRLSFIRTFINTYLNLDGTPFTDTPGYDTLPFWKETVGRDKRLAQTIRTPGYTRLSGGSIVRTPPAFNYTYTGYMPIKWCLDDTYYDGATLNTNCVAFMRYAEILLNYAEAEAELGVPATDYWGKTINLLRKRAGLTGGLTGPPATVDPYMKAHYFPLVDDPAIVEIRRERGIELALEGFRFADLTRWKRGDLVSNKWNGIYVPALNQLLDMDQDTIPDVCFYQGSTAPGNLKTVTYVNVSGDLKLDHGTYGEIHWLDALNPAWDDKFYLYPVPYNDIQLNPNLKPQNPGWGDN